MREKVNIGAKHNMRPYEFLDNLGQKMQNALRAALSDRFVAAERSVFNKLYLVSVATRQCI